MKSISTILFKLTLILVLVSSCDKSEPKIEQEEKVSIVSKFVYDGMSSLYLWNKDVIGNEPTISDNDPKAYFNSLLNQTDKNKGWSWITDDAEELIAEFAGEPRSFGYSLGFLKIGGDIYALVEYIYPGTPAYDAGLERLDLIGKINGQPIKTEKRDGGEYISSEAIDVLYGDNKANFTIYKLTENGTQLDKEIDVVPGKITTYPVLYDNIYEIEGEKIGYIVYNSFISNFNEGLYWTFKDFKDNGVTKLVLDLRYNHGGDISAATYLASMIAPEKDVTSKATFTKLTWNDELGDNIYKLGEYDKKYPDPKLANLDKLEDVYIIATDDSYSASELITFCLRQFIPVTHIGSKTGGKYTASITVHPFDDNLGFALYPSEFFPKRELAPATKEKLHNWAIQPIVAKYTNNKDEDFIATDGLIPDVDIKEGFGYIDNWTQFGDPNDVLLGQALYMISGDESYKPIPPKPTRSLSTSEKIRKRETNIAKIIRKESVILDNINNK